MKECGRCHEVKSLDSFTPNTRYAMGVTAWCKVCASEHNRAYRHRLKDVERAAPPEKMCARCGITRGSSLFALDRSARDGLRSWCKPCNREYQRVHAASARKDPVGKERIRKNLARYRAQDWVKEKARQDRSARHVKDSQDPQFIAHRRQRAMDRYYRIRHTPEYQSQRRLVEARRRSKKRGATIGAFTGNDWLTLLAKYDYRCVYCGTRDQVLEQDHVIPLVQNGVHSLENIVPACRQCNASKNDRTPDQAKIPIRFGDFDLDSAIRLVGSQQLDKPRVRPALPQSKSGVRGVHWDKKRGKWRAQVRANHRRHDLGWFDEIEDADKAVQVARQRLHEVIAIIESEFGKGDESPGS